MPAPTGPIKVTHQKVHAALRKAGYFRPLNLTDESGNNRSIGGYRVVMGDDGRVESVACVLGWADQLPGSAKRIESTRLARYCTALRAAGLPARVEGDRVVFDQEKGIEA